jgi:diguanylate cyclase (GGDEF)-like protein
LEIDHAEARAFWEASLFKAVAARRLVADEKRSEEAFAISLLADMGVGVMAATDASYIEFLKQGQDLKSLLAFEQHLFETTHDQVGEALCDIFKLPEIYKEAISHHHQFDGDLPEDDVIAAVRVVANLPHDIRYWVAEDLEIFDVMASSRFGEQCKSAEQLVQDVHDEFSTTVRQFSGSIKQPCNLRKLLEEALRENALEVTRMAGQLQLLSTNNDKLSSMVNDLAGKHQQAQGAAEHDPLTNLLNRAGFTRITGEKIAAAASQKQSLAVFFIDCDGFKQINDAHGHQAGDTVLTAIAGRLGNKIRRDSDVMARWGGDEMVILLCDVDEQRAIGFARRMIACINEGPIRWHKGTIDTKISGGLYWIEKPHAKMKVDDLVGEADKRMVQAKADRCGLVAAPVGDRRVA